jgi:hypothetical protein
MTTLRPLSPKQWIVRLRCDACLRQLTPPTPPAGTSPSNGAADAPRTAVHTSDQPEAGADGAA